MNKDRLEYFILFQLADFVFNIISILGKGTELGD